MKDFLAKLWSRKLWIYLLGVASIVGGMVAGAIPINEGIDKIIALTYAYLGVQGTVDVVATIKNNKK